MPGARSQAAAARNPDRDSRKVRYTEKQKDKTPSGEKKDKQKQIKIRSKIRPEHS